MNQILVYTVVAILLCSASMEVRENGLETISWNEKDIYLEKYNPYLANRSPIPLLPDSHSSGQSTQAAPPDLCQDASIDAAVTTEDKKTYVFKGDYYWELVGRDPTRIADGYPKRISEDWGGIPGNLDAAFTGPRGHTFFFKGNVYWRFKNKKMIHWYSEDISAYFKGIPNDVDAAFVWGVNKELYFFKGEQYWRYQKPSESHLLYPALIKNWDGLPDNVDAALDWSNSVTYFFKGQNYYKHQPGSYEVVSGPYPTSTRWFGCKKKSPSNEVINMASVIRDDKHLTSIIEDTAYLRKKEDGGMTSQPLQNEGWIGQWSKIGCGMLNHFLC